MTNSKMNSKDPGIIASEKALRRAARRALQLGLQTGTPVYVIKKGKIVDLTKQPRRKTKTKLNPVG
jgi:Fe2+ transport system protein FeoA